LAATSGTATPGWWAFWIMVKYRTRKNYSDGAFLGPRIGDKVFLSFLIATLYWGRGLHSSTFRLNLSALYGIGDAHRGRVARVKGVCRICSCVRRGSRAQVELRSGRA
jgi:hypothetical protein